MEDEGEGDEYGRQGTAELWHVGLLATAFTTHSGLLNSINDAANSSGGPFRINIYPLEPNSQHYVQPLDASKETTRRGQM